MNKRISLFFLSFLLAISVISVPSFGSMRASANASTSTVRLFGTTGNGATLGTSTLVELNPSTGALVSTIGPVGYLVIGLTYDPATGVLYGTTSTLDPAFPNGLIIINMAMGTATRVGTGFGMIVGTLTADSTGNLYGWQEQTNFELVSINTAAGTGTLVGPSGIATTGKSGMSFDAGDNLYFVNGSGTVGEIYTINTSTGAATDTGKSIGPSFAHHGDFNPTSGLYWGIDSIGAGTKNIRVVDVQAGSVTTNLPTINDLHTLTFVTYTFNDVPPYHWAWSWINRLYSAGITSGCGASPLIYCPEDSVSRAQMAVFLERGIHGASFTPPTVTLTFNDTSGNFAQYWIEALKSDGITSGCGPSLYCPDASTTRAEMAIFLLRSKHGASYVPPAASGTLFTDVPSGYWAAAWIEQLANEGITSGCGPSLYCPDATVTRAQMAVFLVRTFNLP